MDDRKEVFNVGFFIGFQVGIIAGLGIGAFFYFMNLLGY